MDSHLPPARGRHSVGGRLLNEFLVGLAILFLAMAADMAVLSSSTDSASEAVLSGRALELARDGMEIIIADPGLAKNQALERSFGAGLGENFRGVFSRRIWLTPMDALPPGLQRATVTVEWNEGADIIRLERYVKVP